ncbi:hypothetical protein BKA62DRAFT_773822 [Auriculariales sp. MPI-PUGE-AT-0066]|nr:hypothetical protein BKA62DRAFT_773822 [Auriculariales sp. MPI-PUGE-AT-0066]
MALLNRGWWDEYAVRDAAGSSWTIYPYDTQPISEINTTRTDHCIVDLCPSQTQAATGLSGPVFINTQHNGAAGPVEFKAQVFSDEDFKLHLGFKWTNPEAALNFAVWWEDGPQFGAWKTLAVKDPANKKYFDNSCEIVLDRKFFRSDFYEPGAPADPSKWFDLPKGKKLDYIFIHGGFGGDTLFVFNRTTASYTPPAPSTGNVEHTSASSNAGGTSSIPIVTKSIPNPTSSGNDSNFVANSGAAAAGTTRSNPGTTPSLSTTDPLGTNTDADGPAATAPQGGAVSHGVSLASLVFPALFASLALVASIA